MERFPEEWPYKIKGPTRGRDNMAIPCHTNESEGKPCYSMHFKQFPIKSGLKSSLFDYKKDVRLIPCILPNSPTYMYMYLYSVQAI